jgi:hypothetical protein
MSNDYQFLSFRGLKYYNPKKGWNEFDDTQKINIKPMPKTVSLNHPELQQPTESVKVNLHTTSTFFDPLMKDLLDRVCADSSDALSTIWKNIVAEIDLLEQYGSTRRELLEQMTLLDQETNELRATITGYLNEAQEIADQQIFTANLRAKISAVAQSRILGKIKTVGAEKIKPDVSDNSCATTKKA